MSNSRTSAALLMSPADRELTFSDSFSFAPGGLDPSSEQPGSPSLLVQGPGKTPFRHGTESNGELDVRNGGSPLKTGNSPMASRKDAEENGETRVETGDVRDYSIQEVDPKLETPRERENQLATRSAPIPVENVILPVDSPNNGRCDSDGVANGIERKLEKESPGVDKQDPPKRQLLATMSAPVRRSISAPLPVSGVECKAALQSNVESHDEGSESTSPLSAKSDDAHVRNNQAGERPCGSGVQPLVGHQEKTELLRTKTQVGERRMKSASREDFVRLAAPEKLSERKKKKLIKHLATIKKDGTVEFDLGESSRLASNLFGPEIFDEGGMVGEEEMIEEDEKPRCVPPLQIAMLIVGTRGDVQPFVAIGKHLQEYGHRVRLATHTNFREFVMTAGLEFYPLGGDPKVLAGYMVKNKGFLPSGPSEIQVQRKQLKAIINSLLPACVATDTESGNAFPFRAQAIIANPPAYGHVHVAEYLQVPLHIFFTMPWTPTSAFPHPLSRVTTPAGYRMSYQVVDSLIWMGIRGMINDFRKKKLRLRPITYFSGSQGSISDMPTGYIWSPHLVPKPKDWGPLVDVVGFCFLNLAQDYKPPKELTSWLDAGPPPVYVGFGSLPVVDPKGMTNIIVKALEATKQRGIINKGWGGMGELEHVPENIYLIEDCPHDWLFKQCAAVVHHGGAGTTAAGLKAACPTAVVPFFGDQPFWGEHIHKNGVGPVPIPVDQFSLDKLVSAIQYMLKDEVKQRAVEISKQMENENGIEGAVAAFHKHLPTCRPEPPQIQSPYGLRFKVLKPFRSYSCFT